MRQQSPSHPSHDGLFAVLCVVVVMIFVSGAVMAADEPDNTSHLPLPRFAALRSGEVNMRTGPGTRYPILWVYTRRGLPVEVFEEFDIWRRVRDPNGEIGWVNKTELTGKRAAMIIGGTHDLHDSPNDKGDIVAHVDAGAIGQIDKCQIDWCRLKFDEARGWLRKTDLWGAYPAEVFN